MTENASSSAVREDVIRAIAGEDRLAPTDREVHEDMADAAIRVMATRHPEIHRLRAWLELIEAKGDGYEDAYFALHGYDAPSADYVESERKVPKNLHPSDRGAWAARRAST